MNTHTNNILTAEELAECGEIANLSTHDWPALQAFAQHAALLGARRALESFQEWNGGANPLWFRDNRYPLPVRREAR